MNQAVKNVPIDYLHNKLTSLQEKERKKMGFFKKISKLEKEKLDAAGDSIVAEFANNMKYGVDPKDKLNLVVVQKHFNWSKQVVGNNKFAYIKMVKGYVDNPQSAKSFDSIAKGLADYIKQSAMYHISEIL